MDGMEYLQERMKELDEVIKENDTMIEQFPNDKVLKLMKVHFNEFKTELQEKINAVTATLAPTP